MKILGVSGYYHDSAAAMVCDGEIVAAAQEERFSRKKHEARFPGKAIAYCLGEPAVVHRDLLWGNGRRVRRSSEVAPCRASA